MNELTIKYRGKAYFNDGTEIVYIDSFTTREKARKHAEASTNSYITTRNGKRLSNKEYHGGVKKITIIRIIEEELY